MTYMKHVALMLTMFSDYSEHGQTSQIYAEH